VLIAAAGLLAPVRSSAQSPKPPSVGFIALAGRDEDLIEAFEAGLKEHGLVPGVGARVEERYGAGSQERMRQDIAALVASGTRVFLAAGGNATRLIQEVSPQAAIVVAGLESLEAAGVSGTIARPGGNVTGFMTFGAELDQKRFELLREVVPSLTRLAAVTQPKNISHPIRLRQVREAAKQFAIDVVQIEIMRPEEISERIAAAQKAGAEAALFMRDYIFETARSELIEASLAARLPSVFDQVAFVQLGGLMSYSPNRPDLFRRSAGYVAKILAGARPADLPIQQPTKLHLVINLKTARALGLNVPQSILLRADEVIE
jgi:putative ABC transport system substrate-binding protein